MTNEIDNGIQIINSAINRVLATQRVNAEWAEWGRRFVSGEDTTEEGAKKVISATETIDNSPVQYPCTEADNITGAVIAMHRYAWMRAGAEALTNNDAENKHFVQRAKEQKNMYDKSIAKLSKLLES